MDLAVRRTKCPGFAPTAATSPDPPSPFLKAPPYLLILRGPPALRGWVAASPYNGARLGLA